MNKKQRNRLKKQLKVSHDIIRQDYLEEVYKLPKTLGGAPENEALAMDSSITSAMSFMRDGASFSWGEAPQFLGYGRLIGLSQHGLIRAGVEMLADEMVRKWITLNRAGAEDSDDSGVPDLEEALEKYGVRKVFRNAIANCGYFGGCLVLIKTDEKGDELRNPLLADADTYRGHKFKGLKIIEAFNVTPGQYNSSEPWEEDYYVPQVWYVQGQPIHASRFLYFSMTDIPTILKAAYNFFGIPLAQSVLDAVMHFEECREAEARLLTKFSLTVLKTQLGEVLAGGTDDNLQRRVKYMVQNRDNDGVEVIDKENEDIVNISTPLAGVTDIVRQSMEIVAAYFGEPVTKMWGISPAGFNATGESDMRNHYEHINSLQEKIMRAPLKKLIKFLQLDMTGEYDENIDFEFNNLSEEDEQKNAAVAKIRVEAGAALIEAGVISVEEERNRISQDTNSGYNNLDPYDMPEEELPEEQLEGEEEFNTDESNDKFASLKRVIAKIMPRAG